MDGFDAYIGIGSNIGNREENIERAIDNISMIFPLIKRSSLYETEPVGYKEQNWFLNCAIKIYAKYDSLGLYKIHNTLQEIEVNMGRTRDIANGPRIIDLDLLLYGDFAFKTKQLRIPHPRLHERRFVLVPLHEIAPDVIHPVLQKSIAELLTELSEEKDDQVYLYGKNRY